MNQKYFLHFIYGEIYYSLPVKLHNSSDSFFSTPSYCDSSLCPSVHIIKFSFPLHLLSLTSLIYTLCHSLQMHSNVLFRNFEKCQGHLLFIRDGVFEGSGEGQTPQDPNVFQRNYFVENLLLRWEKIKLTMLKSLHHAYLGTQ